MRALFCNLGRNVPATIAKAQTSILLAWNGSLELNKNYGILKIKWRWQNCHEKIYMDKKAQRSEHVKIDISYKKKRESTSWPCSLGKPLESSFTVLVRVPALPKVSLKTSVDLYGQWQILLWNWLPLCHWWNCFTYMTNRPGAEEETTLSSIIKEKYGCYWVSTSELILRARAHEWKSTGSTSHRNSPVFHWRNLQQCARRTNVHRRKGMLISTAKMVNPKHG